MVYNYLVTYYIRAHKCLKWGLRVRQYDGNMLSKYAFYSIHTQPQIGFPSNVILLRSRTPKFSFVYIFP